MKSLIDLRIMLETPFSRVAEDIWLDCFFMQILTSLAVRAISSLIVLLARLGLVFDVGQNLGLQFIFSMCEAALSLMSIIILRISSYLISKFAGASELPVFAHFSFVFSFVLFNKLTSFFWVVKLFTFRANTT